MANQKEIRVKIASTKKTMKITSAMKLVAAAKVNKMQKKLLATRPYAEKLKELFTNLKAALSDDDIEANPLLASRPNAKKILLVVIASDRGLCGAYNANVIKATNKRIKELKAENKEVSLITVGRKAKTAFSKASYKEQGIELSESFVNISSIPTSTEAELIAGHAIKAFIDQEVDKVEIISTRFISLVSNEVEIGTFLPVENEEGSEEATAEGLNAQPDVLFEPDHKTLIDTLTPMYTENRVYQAMLEATTSELASRMTAMSNATNNAKEFIRKLTLSYNKARQAAITQEISEIVGGAAALG